MTKPRQSRRPSTERIHASHVSRARNLFREGKYQEALKLCEGFYCTDPSNVENLLIITACHFQLHNIRESIFYGQQAIGVDPSFVEAHVAVGNCLVELGDHDSAIQLYNRALRIHPRCAHAYASLGCLRMKMNCCREAIDCFEMAFSLDPSFVEAMTNLGHALVVSGDNTRGKIHLKNAIRQGSKSCAITWLNIGNVAHDEGDFDTAIENYSQAIKLEPNFIEAQSNLCGSLIELYRASNDRTTLQETISRLERIITSTKQFPSAYRKLGVCYMLQGRYKLAMRHFYNAVTLDPKDVDSLCNLGNIQTEVGDVKKAIKLCLRALRINPTHATAFNSMGLALFRLGHTDDALDCFRTAHKLKPDLPSPCCNIGSVSLELGDPLSAARLSKKAIALDPSVIPAFLNLGNSYFECGRPEYAETCYQTSIDSKTEYAALAFNNLALLRLSQRKFDEAERCSIPLRQNWHPENTASATVAILNAYVCLWSNRSQDFEDIANYAQKGSNTGGGSYTIQPFYAQVIPQITPRVALHLSNATSRKFHQKALSLDKNKDAPFKINLPQENERINIGYISANFGNHTTGFLTQGIFARHSKFKFRVVCFSLASSDDSVEMKRIEMSADSFINLSNVEYSKAVRRIREQEIHVLIDLDGYTKDARPEIFSLRPAPIQISMIGHRATTGTRSGIDYIVGDRYTIPADHRQYFSEKILYMPHIVNSYRDTGTHVQIMNINSSEVRDFYGISDDAFVYACFSQPYKIDPDLFATFMEILNKVPNSLLILIRYSAAMEEHLRREASKAKIAEERIIFFDLVPRNEHLVRCRIADVFLDTRVCSGIATSCDAIWSGTPMITIAGDRVCNRVGAGILASVGLERLVVSNLEDYKELAISLSEDDDEFIDIIRLLDDSREVTNLFNCQKWVDSFELAIEKVVGRHHRGLEPDHFEP